MARKLSPAPIVTFDAHKSRAVAGGKLFPHGDVVDVATGKAYRFHIEGSHVDMIALYGENRRLVAWNAKKNLRVAIVGAYVRSEQGLGLARDTGVQHDAHMTRWVKLQAIRACKVAALNADPVYQAGKLAHENMLRRDAQAAANRALDVCLDRKALVAALRRIDPNRFVSGYTSGREASDILLQIGQDGILTPASKGVDFGVQHDAHCYRSLTRRGCAGSEFGDMVPITTGWMQAYNASIASIARVDAKHAARVEAVRTAAEAASDEGASEEAIADFARPQVPRLTFTAAVLLTGAQIDDAYDAGNLAAIDAHLLAVRMREFWDRKRAPKVEAPVVDMVKLRGLWSIEDDARVSDAIEAGALDDPEDADEDFVIEAGAVRQDEQTQQERAPDPVPARGALIVTDGGLNFGTGEKTLPQILYEDMRKRMSRDDIAAGLSRYAKDAKSIEGRVWAIAQAATC